MHDVIVVDEEHVNASSNFITICSSIDGLVDRYIGLMEKAYQTGLMSGTAAEALQVYVEYAKTLQGAASIIAGRNSEIGQSFLAAIDTADTYLF